MTRCHPPVHSVPTNCLEGEGGQDTVPGRPRFPGEGGAAPPVTSEAPERRANGVAPERLTSFRRERKQDPRRTGRRVKESYTLRDGVLWPSRFPQPQTSSQLPLDAVSTPQASPGHSLTDGRAQQRLFLFKQERIRRTREKVMTLLHAGSPLRPTAERGWQPDSQENRSRSLPCPARSSRATQEGPPGKHAHGEGTGEAFQHRPKLFHAPRPQTNQSPWRLG